MELDYLFLNDLFSRLDAVLVDRLITNPPVMGEPLVEAVLPFSGNPIEAVNMVLGTRVGTKNVILYGYSQEVVFEQAATGQAISNDIPVNIMIVRSFEGRAGRLEDFQALNTLQDAVYRLLRHANVSPNTLGVYAYHALSMSDLATEAGGWGGRRFVYNMVRAADPQSTNLLEEA